ncbi:MAG: hypothetical protein ACRDYC_12330, partial [Acidimicrobiales bacterium]
MDELDISPLSRRRFLSGSAALLGTVSFGALLDACGSASPSVGTSSGSTGTTGGGTLIIAMTASELPGLDTVDYQTQGGEGGRFVSVQL